MSKKSQWILVGILFCIFTIWIINSQGKEMAEINDTNDSLSSGQHYEKAEKTAEKFVNLVRNENFEFALDYCTSDISEFKLSTLSYPRIYTLERRSTDSNRVVFWVIDKDENKQKIELKYKKNEWRVSNVF
jgi:hypothetical protein